MESRRGITRIEFAVMLVVGAVVLGFMMFCAGVTWPVESFWKLLSGWLTYPFKQAGQITIEWISVGIACLALVLFSVGIHSLLKWLHGLRQTDRDWPFPDSLKIVAVILFAFVAGISMIGIAHQITWMATTDEKLIGSSRVAARRSASKNNLKQLGLACHDYHDRYETLPAGITYSSTGDALHSWQTTLLPFLEEERLYEQLDLSKPWHDPNNREHFQKSLAVFLNPGISGFRRQAEDSQPAPSHYAGNIRVLKPGQGLKFQEIRDGMSNTFLAGEVNSNFKAWGDPTNLRDPMLGINRSSDGFGSPFKGGAQMLMSDGSVRFISNEIDLKIFQGLGTPAGGEEIDNDSR